MPATLALYSTLVGEAHTTTTAPGGPAPPAVAYVFADGRGTAMRQYWMPTRYRPDR